MHKLRLLLSILMLLFIWQPVKAHENVPAITTLTFTQEQSFEIVFEVNLEALIAKIGPQHEDTDDAPTAQLYNELRSLPPKELKKQFGGFSEEFTAEFGLFFEGQHAAAEVTNVDIPEVGDISLARESKVHLSGSIPTGTNSYSWAYPQRYGASVLRVERPGQELDAQFFYAGLVGEPREIGLAQRQSFFVKVGTYVVVGFTHILPKGLDHILFVLGLFLLSTRWKPLLVQVTAFTLAHSVTLALGLYGVVKVSPSIVEPLIALSIVYVAVENLMTRKLQVWRPIIVFAFGLLHGLGFAGILIEIGLPRSDFVLGLVAFNIGVEFGQLAIIALAFLAVGLAMKKSWYHARIVAPASLAIAAMGAWWFVERTIP